MSLEEVKRNLEQTIKRGGNEKVIESLEKKLKSLDEKQINKKL